MVHMGGFVLSEMVGRVFKYTQQVCKFQIMTTGRLLATLDIRPNH